MLEESAEAVEAAEAAEVSEASETRVQLLILDTAHSRSGGDTYAIEVLETTISERAYLSYSVLL